MTDTKTSIVAKPWTKSSPPKRILAIRLQALGDLVITLPYLQSLRKNSPNETRIDLLTREEVESIPRALNLFDNVYSIKGGRDLKKQLLHSFLLLPRLMFNRYDMVLDLQNNIVSKIFRKGLFPAAWSVFDRFSALPAGEWTRLAIEAAGAGSVSIEGNFSFRKDGKIHELLRKNGWDGSSGLVALNPAGAFPTRNWPTEYYIDFARRWLQRFPETMFIIIGVEKIAGKTLVMKESLGRRLIDLVGKTTEVEAFAIVQQLDLILTEDSGLMHMAWVSGIPTLALFGSTRRRAMPLGAHSYLLDSSDLPCGNCMKEECIYGDTRCLLRYNPELVFAKAVELLKQRHTIPAGQ